MSSDNLSRALDKADKVIQRLKRSIREKDLEIKKLKFANQELRDILTNYLLPREK